MQIQTKRVINIEQIGHIAPGTVITMPEKYAQKLIDGGWAVSAMKCYEFTVETVAGSPEPPPEAPVVVEEPAPEPVAVEEQPKKKRNQTEDKKPEEE